MLFKNMIKLSLLLLISTLFSACINKHGISAKYYSDCKEYYDLQGYYHKECGEDDIITYEEMGNLLTPDEKKPESNVW